MRRLLLVPLLVLASACGSHQNSSGSNGTPRRPALAATCKLGYTISGFNFFAHRPAGVINTAQVKLGRRDARLLIDVTTVAHQHVGPYLPDLLTAQIEQILGQLTLGQVSAEGHASSQGEPEEIDLDRVPTPPATGAAGPVA